MPSWPNSEGSSTSLPGHFTAMDYAPSFIVDPLFDGVAVDCPHVCRGHKLEPRRCVAFGGTDTGRRFYLCSVLNEVENCGFVAWHDEEWPETAHNALNRIWGMYYDSNQARVDERIENARLVQALSDDKKRIEKKHSSLNSDVNKFMDDTADEVMQKNLRNARNGSEEELEKERDLLKAEVDVLKNAIGQLKNVLKSQAESFKVKQDRLASVKDDVMMENEALKMEKETLKVALEAQKVEREALVAEKKKLEYKIFDMFKAFDVNKGKLKKIKAMVKEMEEIANEE